ncbi:MAG: hypothetical protein ABMB14_32955 [Myxococcota bacterium]
MHPAPILAWLGACGSVHLLVPPDPHGPQQCDTPGTKLRRAEPSPLGFSAADLVDRLVDSALVVTFSPPSGPTDLDLTSITAFSVAAELSRDWDVEYVEETIDPDAHCKWFDQYLRAAIRVTLVDAACRVRLDGTILIAAPSLDTSTWVISPPSRGGSLSGTLALDDAARMAAKVESQYPQHAPITFERIRAMVGGVGGSGLLVWGLYRQGSGTPMSTGDARATGQFAPAGGGVPTACDTR